MSTFGTHLIIDLYFEGDFPQGLEDSLKLELIQNQIVEKLKLSSLKKINYKFEPQGYTGIELLSESHLSIHTWPERNYIALDVFSCIALELDHDFQEWVKLLFGAHHIKLQAINRYYTPHQD